MTTKVKRIRLDKTVRPWGTFYNLERDDGYLVKKLHLHPDSRTSLQYHSERDEVRVVVGGQGLAWHFNSAGEPFQETIGPGDVIKVSVREPHRIENTSSVTDLVIVEVQLGEICEEDDIVRVADDYGRVG